MGRILAGTLIGLVLVFGSVACDSGDNVYVKDNKRLLESLPVPAGAERLRVTSVPYYKAEGEESEADIVDGYTTNAVYEVESGTTDEVVIEFYAGVLEDGWEHCRKDVPVAEPVPSGMTPGPSLGKILVAHFVRGPERVSVTTYGLFRPTDTGTFEVVVDHDSRLNPCTGEELR